MFVVISIYFVIGAIVISIFQISNIPIWYHQNLACTDIETRESYLIIANKPCVNFLSKFYSIKKHTALHRNGRSILFDPCGVSSISDASPRLLWLLPGGLYIPLVRGGTNRKREEFNDKNKDNSHEHSQNRESKWNLKWFPVLAVDLTVRHTVNALPWVDELYNPPCTLKFGIHDTIFNDCLSNVGLRISRTYDTWSNISDPMYKCANI